ncbi:carbon-monoxide dehydrogenase small subunit [Amorphus suaedae]
MTAPRTVRFRLNGSDTAVTVEPRRTVADMLRLDLRLTGTTVGCDQGVCGTCTVIIDGEPVRACLMFAAQLDGAEVRTVEGLAKDGKLSALQQAFIDEDAVQCGYCTPGFLMLATAALENDPFIEDEAIDAVLSANLCRCTGYGPIRRAVRKAAKTGRRST